MAINITRNHDLGIAEAKLRIERFRSDVEARYGLSSSWDENDLCFSGNGVKGKVEVREENVFVDVRLGFAMMMLESSIKSQLSSAMDEHLA